MLPLSTTYKMALSPSDLVCFIGTAFKYGSTEELINGYKELIIQDNTPLDTFLGHTIAQNREAVVEWFYDNFPDTKAISEIRQIRLLEEAIAKGNLNIVKLVFDNSQFSNINQVKPLLRTVLERAVQHRHDPVIDWILSMGFRLSTENSFKHNILYQMIASGNLKEVRRFAPLFKAQGLLHKPSGQYQVTPFAHACGKKSLFIVQYLFALGATNDDAALVNAALVNAVSYSSQDVVQWLLNNVVELPYPKHLLHMASRIGNLEVVKWLVCAGICPVNELDDDGCTALKYAVMCKKVVIIKWLITCGGADPTIGVCRHPRECSPYPNLPNTCVKRHDALRSLMAYDDDVISATDIHHVITINGFPTAILKAQSSKTVESLSEQLHQTQSAHDADTRVALDHAGPVALPQDVLNIIAGYGESLPWERFQATKHLLPTL